jgi:hypothetical protein
MRWKTHELIGRGTWAEKCLLGSPDLEPSPEKDEWALPVRLPQMGQDKRIK